LARNISSKKKTPKSEVEDVILKLCAVKALTLAELMHLLNRSEGVIRKDYLRPLLKDKKLRYRFPTKPQHPDQAYITERES